MGGVPKIESVGKRNQIRCQQWKARKGRNGFLSLFICFFLCFFLPFYPSFFLFSFFLPFFLSVFLSKLFSMLLFRIWPNMGKKAAKLWTAVFPSTSSRPTTPRSSTTFLTKRTTSTSTTTETRTNHLRNESNLKMNFLSFHSCPIKKSLFKNCNSNFSAILFDTHKFLISY